MTQLFILDGNKKPKYNTFRTLDKKETDFDKAIKSICSPKDRFLIRTKFFPYNRGRLDEIKKMLSWCLENGNDRSEESLDKIADHFPGARENECIWAIPFTNVRIKKRGEIHDYPFMEDALGTLNNHIWREYEGMYEQFGEYIGEMYLVIDAKAYCLRGQDSTRFYQKNLQKRRKGLLGIIAFDNNENTKEPKKMLSFSVMHPLQKEVIEKISKAGYFQD